ncbi:MAG: cytochrome c3 family protein [Candidatus Brocadiales bacterium]
MGKITFTHKSHVEIGFSCTGCHPHALERDEAGMPDKSLCIWCHGEQYEGKPIAAIYTKRKWEIAKEKQIAMFADVKFSHTYHLGYGAKCMDCHDGIGESEKVTLEHIPGTGACTQCHANWREELLCEKCHKDIRYNIPPSDHEKANYIETHGKEFKRGTLSIWERGAGRQLCFECHAGEYCINCHHDQEPRDHTNQWRLAGHGVTAGIDRDRCEVCHKVDFCVRCHESIRPRSHFVARWGFPLNRHCRRCHLPLGGTECTFCHTGTQSHLEAPERPDDTIHPGVPPNLCRDCHKRGGRGLFHVDNGDNCLRCHR